MSALDMTAAQLIEASEHIRNVTKKYKDMNPIEAEWLKRRKGKRMIAQNSKGEYFIIEFRYNALGLAWCVESVSKIELME